MPFDFKQQDVSLMFEAHGDPLRDLRNIPVQPDPHLNVSSLLSQDDVVVLQSPTASTLVEVRSVDGRTFSATMTTRYFGEFVDQRGFDKRGAYTREKMKRLIELLATAGAKLLFCGLVTLARWEIEVPKQEEFRKRVAGQFPGLTQLAEGDVPFDFIMRASRCPDEDRFSNIQLAWYEERSFTVPIGLRAAQGGSMGVPEWEMAVAGAGLELRYDQNNKRALRAGRRQWTPQDFQGLVDSYLGDLPGAVNSVQAYLGASNA